MGHLINPIAFRLGYTRSWEDTWFVKNIYYPEFLHSILKIRNYIYYFWTMRFMEKKGFLLSHLFIYKYIKNLLIKIFLYNTDIEKYTYSFFAKGSTIFSDAVYYRFKKKQKKKKAFFYERYKPDFFFIIFLYSYFFLKKNINIKKKEKIKGFKYYYNLKKKKRNNKFKKANKIFKFLYKQNYNRINVLYLDNIKKGNLNFFLKVPKKKNNEHLIISKYEDSIEQVKGKFNMGFFDFIMYLFFKISWWDKEEDDILRLKTKRKNLEMVLNFPVKIKRLILLLKKYINLNIKLSSKEKVSIKSFIFFLVFIMEFLFKAKKNKMIFKLRDLNLKLIRLLFFNKILVGLGFFFGEFLRHILYLLTNIRKYNFRFCFLSNVSLNAKFLARYIALKLKRKFPLFFVINPIKRELKKLFLKKKEKRFSLFINLFELKKKNTIINKLETYKAGFKAILLYLYKKYVELSVLYYNEQKTLITFDFYIYFLILKNKYENQMSIQQKIYNYFFEKKWKKHINKKKKIYINLNYRWIKFLKNFINKGYSVLSILFMKKSAFFSKLYLFIKNKLLISLFFGSNKYNIDSLAHLFFNLRFNKSTFFYINTKFINLFMYQFFNNYIFLNFNTLSYIDSKYLIISNYFFKSFLYYNYTLYSFNKFVNYLNINKKKNYYKMKDYYKINSFIMGFKMSFKGRFSRKQRASSIWFHQGFVPLNTVKAFIDYAFFTIPLKNSAISVKLWLYKNTEITHWHYKFYNDLKISIN